MTRPVLTHYFDYKSSYAYLAQEETFALAEAYDIELVLLPYTIDIPGYLGSARVDAAGNVLEEQRNAHQWRRVRYMYMDCRREANRRGLTIRGTHKIFDSSIAHIGYLHARREGDFRPYHDRVFERFWKRELDIEDPKAIAAVLDESGLNGGGFAEFLAGRGREEYDRLQAEAIAAGVFGIPSYVFDGELFWGAERLPRVRERIAVA